MYIVPVKVAKSEIHGKGVFAVKNIPKGNIVWIYKDNHDFKLSAGEFDALPKAKKASIKRTGYLSPWSGYWVLPPDNDPAKFTNHSPENNLSVVFDEKVSSEPHFVSNRNIEAGEELTNNYHEFDTLTQQTSPKWAK